MSEIVCYDNYAFWTYDETIRFWLHLVLQEIKREPDVAPWLTEASQKWREIAYDRRPVCQLDFDDILDSEQKRLNLLPLFRRAFESLEVGSKVCTKDELNSLHPGGSGHVSWLKDQPISHFLQAGRAFVHLLERHVDIPTPVGKVKDWSQVWEMVYSSRA